MHYCDCKGTTKLQLLQRVFQRMLTEIPEMESSEKKEENLYSAYGTSAGSSYGTSYVNGHYRSGYMRNGRWVSGGYVKGHYRS